MCTDGLHPHGYREASLCQSVPALYQPAPNVIPSWATIQTRMDSGPPVDGSMSSVVTLVRRAHQQRLDYQRLDYHHNNPQEPA